VTVALVHDGDGGDATREGRYPVLRVDVGQVAGDGGRLCGEGDRLVSFAPPGEVVEVGLVGGLGRRRPVGVGEANRGRVERCQLLDEGDGRGDGGESEGLSSDNYILPEAGTVCAPAPVAGSSGPWVSPVWPTRASRTRDVITWSS